MRFDELFIKKTVPSVSIQGSLPENPHFVVDSRRVSAGDIFVAIPGSRVDGHEFAVSALEKGAWGVLINRDQQEKLMPLMKPLKPRLVIVVDDTVSALIDLANCWRSLFSIPIVAITGSVGKTSTKEIVAAIVRAAGINALVNEGNQNTKIGVSLNILRMRPEHHVAIFEVGISKRGEMAELAQLIRPTIGVITTVGHSHMEGLGSLHDIALEKRDLFKCFTEQNIGVVNGDIPQISTVSYPHPVVRFGLKTINQVQARKIKMAGSSVSFVLKIYKEKYSIVLPHGHMGSVLNSLAATVVAHLLGVPHQVIVAAIAKPLAIPGRFERKQMGDSTTGIIINDCYNASPESMKAALIAFEHMETPAQKIAVLGDMLELGVNSPFWHRQLGRFIRKVPSLNRLILVGSLVQWTKKTLPIGLAVELVPTWQDAVSLLDYYIKQDESLVLVKGSRGMALDNLVDACTRSTAQEKS